MGLDYYELLLRDADGRLRNELVGSDGGGVWFDHSAGVVAFRDFDREAKRMVDVATFPIGQVQMIWKVTPEHAARIKGA